MGINLGDFAAISTFLVTMSGNVNNMNYNYYLLLDITSPLEPKTKTVTEKQTAINL